jgi:small subunit ribosomal protein S17
MEVREMADEKTTEETTDETPEVEAVADEAVADGSDQVAEGDLVADVPAAETEPAPAAEAPAVPPAQSEPKRKKKRLPRALRPAKTRPGRPAKTGERKPIADRTPPADTERGRRQERRGVVVSNAMDKTIVVKVDVIKSHPRYKKVVRRSVKFHAHDEQNAANVGDVVRIVETRPLSATKHWRLAEIVEAAK